MLWQQSVVIHLLHLEIREKENPVCSQQTVRHTGHHQNFVIGNIIINCSQIFLLT